jgi:hypothetical protein
VLACIELTVRIRNKTYIKNCDVRCERADEIHDPFQSGTENERLISSLRMKSRVSMMKAEKSNTRNSTLKQPKEKIISACKEKSNSWDSVQ